MAEAGASAAEEGLEDEAADGAVSEAEGVAVEEADSGADEEDGVAAEASEEGEEVGVNYSKLLIVPHLQKSLTISRCRT